MTPIFFLDIDTQKDFLYPDGAAYLPNGEKILPVLTKLTQFARERGLKVISTACVHDEDGGRYHGLAPHCRKGRDGATKVPESLLLNHHTLENRLLDRNMVQLLERYDQVVLEKEDFGFFANPNAARLLACLGKNAFLYGCQEDSLTRSIHGLLEKKVQVVVVEDACAFQQPATAKRALTALEKSGVRRLTTKQLFATLSD